MGVPKDTLWEVDPHTLAKHEILRRYLQAWFPILSSNFKRIVYIDGFSGPGHYKGNIPGSPIIALNVAIKHQKTLKGEVVFWFIEERDDRIAQLKQEISKMDNIPSHFKVRVESGTFHKTFSSVLDSIESDGANLAPTFAFIDPFGYSGIPFSLLQRLLKQKRCEALVTFMADSVNRFLKHPEEKIVQHIIDLFGTNEVMKIAGEQGGDRVGKLRALYQSQLHQVAKYVRYFEIRNLQDRLQYYLFFVTNNELGHLKMKEAMWKVDRTGEFQFSDATNPDQTVLFEVDNTSALIDQLTSKFKGKGIVTSHDVLKYVENDTAYLKKHMTKALRREEAAGRLKVEPLKSDGQPRRPNTYPDNTSMNFI